MNFRQLIGGIIMFSAGIVITIFKKNPIFSGISLILCCVAYFLLCKDNWKETNTDSEGDFLIK